MQLYRDLSLFTCFKFLKEAVIADFRWLLGMNKISASKIVFLQPRYLYKARLK
jgi:polyphosphate kinase